MKITDIKRQKRKVDRFNIYVDGRFDFALAEEEMVKNKIEIGKEMDKEEIGALKEVDERAKVFNKSLDYLSRRSHSVWEIKEKLKRKKYRGDLIEEAANRLIELGYLDDEKFAREFIESRIKTSPRGKRLIKRELQQKRVGGETIDRILEVVYNNDEEIKALKDLIKRKNKTEKADKRKLMAYLLRRGFSFEDIKENLG